MQLEFVLILMVSALSVLVVVGLASMVRIQRQLRQTDEQLVTMSERLTLFDDGSQGLGRRLLALDRQLQKIVDQQASANPAAASAGNSGQYLEVLEWIRQGRSVDDIAQHSGMSAAEIELLMLVDEKQSKERVP